MRSKLLACIFICLPILCMAQNKMDNQGRRQGDWVKVDKNNRKIYEGTFVDGYEVGTFTYYYGDGSVRMKNMFSDKGRYCRHEAYSKNGKLMATGFYNQKNKDSIWHIYNEKGNLMKTDTYKMGTKTGKSMLFSEHGDTLEIQYWNDNKKHGYWYRKTKSGYITGNYVNDLLNGAYAEYVNKKTATQGNYSDGLKNGLWKFWNGNNLEIIEKWNYGALRDRKVLVYAGKPEMISIDDIAYFYPKGQTTVIIKMNGETLTTHEEVQSLYNKIGDEYFVTLDKERQLIGAYRCIKGFSKDEQGNEIVNLSPNPGFTLYPDENCKKLIQSVTREGME